MTPVRSHMAKTRPGEPSARMSSAGVRKMPIPTTMPTTTELAAAKPRGRCPSLNAGVVSARLGAHEPVRRSRAGGLERLEARDRDPPLAVALEGADHGLPQELRRRFGSKVEEQPSGAHGALEPACELGSP